MSDYSQMSDEQLNREVATRLGYHVDIGDLNAATALDFGKWTLNITIAPNDGIRVIADTDQEGEIVIATGPREKLARAISEAWLMWWDATKGDGT